MSALYQLNNIEKHYDGKKILSIEKLTLEENQIIGFFGPNGSGKSTLFSLLSFIEKQTEGDMFFNGVCNKKINFETKQNVVMVPQNPYLLKRTVFENVSYGLKLRGEKYNLEERALEALSLVGLDSSFMHRKWSQLSGGEAQRVALASRLILKPKVLILDEPTTGVDTNSAQLIKEAILSAKQKYNTTIMISSHDHNWLNHICDKRIGLFQGELVENGSVNLLYAPWEKDENGNLVKLFIDGQKLTVPNSADKKRDAILMINSGDFKICKSDCDKQIDETTLKGKIISIHQQEEERKLLVEFTIAGIGFNCRICRSFFIKQSFLPGDDIYVNLKFSNLQWI